MTILYQFSDGATATSDITVDCAHEEGRGGIKHFEKFARSQAQHLITNSDEVIFTYEMSGGAKAAQALAEYCYSGDYS